MIALVWALAACGGPKAAPEIAPQTTTAAPAPQGDGMESIEETTVGELGGRRVGMANVFEDTYTLPDGTTKTGLTCLLSVFDIAKYRVGEGSEITVDGVVWRVVKITKVSGENGEVTLAPAR